MSVYRHEPLAPRGPGRATRRPTFWILAVVLTAGVVLSGAMTAPASDRAGPSGDAASTAPASSAAPAASTTHGDLNVTAGETFYIPGPTPPAVPSTYYQGGNITVFNGGKLIVQNVTLSFVQFVATAGVPLTRLSHIFHFTVRPGGVAIFRNATLTTDAFVVNPYVKLTVVVDGNLTLYDSNIEAPGFVYVGDGGNLTLNASSLGPSPSISHVVLRASTLGDLGFAPTLNVTGGGTANLFSSVYRDLYADNLLANGPPYPVSLNATSVLAGPTAPAVTAWTTGTDPGSVIQDYLYPKGIAGGEVTFGYTDPNNKTLGNTSLTFTLTYDGTAYALGTYLFVYGTSGIASFPFPAALSQQVNTTGGMLGWLNRSGDFGLPSGISISFSGSGPAVDLPSLQIQPYSPLDFGLDASGSTSTLNTVNSYIGLDFAPAGSEPWVVHQLVLTGSASAYLANLTVQGNFQNGTVQTGPGAITADGASNAYLYRWADVQSFGRGGALPVPGATVTVQYAYNSSQLDNATANRLNAIKTADPPIWAYLQFWDTLNGFPGYGESAANGVASVLVASNDIYGASTPDGDYLGDYHVSVTPPAGSGPAQGFTALVSPYPQGVANGSAGYGVPDSWGHLLFPLYYASVVPATGGIVVTANNKTSTTVLIGEELGVNVTVEDNGPAPIRELSGTLYYNATSAIVVATDSESVDLTAPTQTATLHFVWKVNDTVTGDHLKTVADNLSIGVIWNYNIPADGGGTVSTYQVISVQPSNVALANIVFPGTTLTSGDQYKIYGDVIYNGSFAATVTLIAWAPGAGRVVLGTDSVPPARIEGNPVFFNLQWVANGLKTGTGYHLSLLATYNGVIANDTSPNTFTVPPPPVTQFLFEKFFGLPLWEWIVIAAAVALAIAGFLLWSRQQAAGKLVECGECGNLVPEDAKVCPKCGAEFESDVVRCSRCASTIPANSKFCPECAAQLLGKPGEEGVDPERQAYEDFTERYRAEAKKDLGENYSEGAFWDWWKRQASYTPFSQWKTQQSQGAPRVGMTAPPPRSPPSGGGAGAAGAAPRRAGAPPRPRAPGPTGAPAAPAAAPLPSTAPIPPPAPAPAPGALKPCPNCGKEIPPEYLVCPFCGSVTQ